MVLMAWGGTPRVVNKVVQINDILCNVHFDEYGSVIFSRDAEPVWVAAPQNK